MEERVKSAPCFCLIVFKLRFQQIMVQMLKVSSALEYDYHQLLEKNWPSRGMNQRPPVLKSCSLPTELPGRGLIKLKEYADDKWKVGKMSGITGIMLKMALIPNNQPVSHLISMSPIFCRMIKT